jgi:hypothetical protein
MEKEWERIQKERLPDLEIINETEIGQIIKTPSEDDNLSESVDLLLQAAD